MLEAELSENPKPNKNVKSSLKQKCILSIAKSGQGIRAEQEEDTFVYSIFFSNPLKQLISNKQYSYQISKFEIHIHDVNVFSLFL